MPSQWYTRTQYSPLKLQSSWDPGWTQRFPWQAFYGLIGSLIASGLAVFIIVFSDGSPVSKWSLQPTVYLAIMSALTNVLLHSAFTRGLNVIWWRRAMESEYGRVKDLHTSWAFGNSIRSAIMSGKRFNIIALACIFVTLSPVNGPLLQRASIVGEGTFHFTKDITVYLAQRIPQGYSGYISGREHRCSLLTPAFTKVVNKWITGEPINITATQCYGSCKTIVRGAGFKVNCSAAEASYNTLPKVFKNGSVAPESFIGTQVFQSSFNWYQYGVGDAETINLDLQFKNESSCRGKMQIRNCTLRHAVVDYPVVIINQTNIALAPGSTIFDDKFVKLQPVSALDPATMSGPTTIGGFGRALTNSYGSSASVQFEGPYNYDVLSTGATAMRYARTENVESDGYVNCTIRFQDPTEELLAGARELIFRSAIASASWSDARQVTSEEVVILPVFVSMRPFLLLSLIFTALGAVFTIGLFNGYWKLGRSVSMSPVETARAFAPSQLENVNSNANIDELLQEVGERPIQYGVARRANGALLPNDMDSSPDMLVEYFLEMQHPDFSVAPQCGRHFSGENTPTLGTSVIPLAERKPRREGKIWKTGTQASMAIPIQSSSLPRLDVMENF